jgi:hypothetical protein
LSGAVPVRRRRRRCGAGKKNNGWALCVWGPPMATLILFAACNVTDPYQLFSLNADSTISAPAFPGSCVPSFLWLAGRLAPLPGPM